MQRQLLIFLCLWFLTPLVASPQTLLGGKAIAGGQTVIRRAAAGGGGCSGVPCNAVLDDFNRTNEGPPPSASWGGVILGSGASGSGMQVFSSTVAGPSAAGNVSAYWGTSFGSKQECYVDITTVSGSYPACWTHVTNPGNNTLMTGYQLQGRQPDGVLRLERWDPSYSAQPVGADIAQAISSGDSLRLTDDGAGVFTIWYKVGAGAWTNMGTRTDATYTGSGFIGMGNYSVDQNDRLDNFGGGTLP